ncbi:MAG: adenylate/guanylate cyclase domain-containing protein [Cyanobacteria bacterium P01_C01_bin.89]
MSRRKSLTKTLQRWLWSCRGILVVAPIASGLVFGAHHSGLLQGGEWSAYDWLMRQRPEEEKDDRIAIVSVDDRSLQQIGQSIVPDDVYADLLDKLAAMEPRMIGLDIYRDVRTRDVRTGKDSKRLDEVFRRLDNVVGIAKIIGDNERERVAPPPILQEKEQVAMNDLLEDGDTKVRRGFIYANNVKGEQIYSFAAYLAFSYLIEEGVNLETIETTDPWGLRLGEVEFWPFQGDDGGYIRAEDDGFQVLINYRDAEEPFEVVSMADVLDGTVPDDWARDRIILIGSTAESAGDFLFTPYSGGWLELAKKTPGVEIHAHLTSQLISAALDNRTMIRSLAEWQEHLWVIFWVLVSSTLTWILRLPDNKQMILVLGGIGIASSLGTLFGITIIAFNSGLWIPLEAPVAGYVLGAAGVGMYLARSAGKIRETFGRYLTAEVVSTILENPEGASLGGDRRNITILTSDLRGFTATAERLPPEEVIEILNLYLEYMADAITAHNGTIDEFMGDGILVFFGAPIAREDDAQRALACAIAMQRAMKPVNEKMVAMGHQPLQMGIGVHSGEVVVGNIGSQKRTKYGAVGSAMNLTYRVESYTIGGQILITEETLNMAGGEDFAQVRSTQQVQPKGVKQPMTIYEISGVGGSYNLSLASEDEEFVPLALPILLTYQLLDGKHVGDRHYEAEIMALSDKGAEIELVPGSVVDDSDPNGVRLPGDRSNIKMVVDAGSDAIMDDWGESDREIYGKVTAVTVGPNTGTNGSTNGNINGSDPKTLGFTVRFTAKPPALDRWLKSCYDRAMPTTISS